MAYKMQLTSLFHLAVAMIDYVIGTVQLNKNFDPEEGFLADLFNLASIFFC